MIQAEIGGAARVDSGIDIQRPGFLIRDFALKSSHGDDFRLSSLRSRSNLVVVFAGYSDVMRALLEDAALHIGEFSAQDATIVVIVPYGPEKKVFSIPGDSPIILLHDKTHAAYRLSGAIDEKGGRAPLVYLTVLCVPLSSRLSSRTIHWYARHMKEDGSSIDPVCT